MRRTVFNLLWLALGALLAIALLEAVLRFLPVTMGIYRTTQFERWPLQNAEPHLPYANSHTWALLNTHRGLTNNYGHIAPFDYKKNSHPILVIGDSFVESLMNDHADTLQGQLGEKMGTPESVYGLGVSGLSASDYVALSRLARDEFKPVAAVFLVTDGDFSESLGQRLGNYFLTPTGQTFELDYAPLQGDTFMKRIRKSVGDFALYRYLQVNLQFAPKNLVNVFQKQKEPAVQVHATPSPEKIRAQQKVADWFLAELPSALGIPPECIVFLVDSDRYAIYKADLASPRKDSPQVRQHFITRARQLGFKLRDLDPVFRQLYAQNQTKFDHWPMDRHWNKVGHGVGANEAYRLLFLDGQTRRQPCLANQHAAQ